jgi:hypothetical protein
MAALCRSVLRFFRRVSTAAIESAFRGSCGRTICAFNGLGCAVARDAGGVRECFPESATRSSERTSPRRHSDRCNVSVEKQRADHSWPSGLAGRGRCVSLRLVYFLCSCKAAMSFRRSERWAGLTQACSTRPVRSRSEIRTGSTFNR